MSAAPNPDRTAHRILNRGPMNEFVGPFDVASKLTDEAYHVRFSHLWNGIATRHSDTIDTKFFVDGRTVIVGLAHTGLLALGAQANRNVSDREASFLAAEYLRERLEQADDRPLLDVSQAEVLRRAEKLGLH
jgi:hypothetical protein